MPKELPRISADFNTMTSEPVGWVKLGQVGTPNGDRLPPLQDGERVVLWEEGLEAEAVVSFDPADGYWLALPDRATWRDIPLTQDEDAQMERTNAE
jgi:hypothetical protein